MQIDGMSGAMLRADYAIGVLKKQPITLENLELMQGTISWLEGVSANLRTEMHDLVKRMPPQDPQTARPASLSEAKRLAVMKGK